VSIAEQVDLHLMKIAFPSSTAAQLIPWIEPMRAACSEFGIDTVQELASFLANIAVESQDLKILSESLNYSVLGLLGTFGRHRISIEAAQRLGRRKYEKSVPLDRQRQIANLLYGGSWGLHNLGNKLPDDGWNFRGGGIKQITGRSNFQRLADYFKMPIEKVRDYIVNNKTGSCRAAGWFWRTHGLDRKAATPSVEDDRRAINGGLNGIEVVRPRYAALIKELRRRGC
jgi:putative chitinase